MKSRDKVFDKKYDTYVEHPRFGRRPRCTGVNPGPYDFRVNFHPNATSIHEIQKRCVRLTGKRLGFLKELEAITLQELPRIAGTAVKAEPEKQNQPTIPVTHYFDVERLCRDCKRPFIFFAEEQKYLYETLKFPLNSDCVRCPNCRKTERLLARTRATYERLAGTKRRNWKDDLKMAGSALTLVENGIFGSRVIQTIRRLLKTTPETERTKDEYLELAMRLKRLGRQN